MASLTKYAGTISQTTGGKYRTFSDLNNLKNNVEGSWANSNGNIKGKSSSPNRPSTLSFTNFGFNLPTGAEVSKIVITYRHKKTGSLSIGAPTISLLGIGGFSSKAVAPKTSMETHTKSFYADGAKNNNLITPTTNKVTRSTVNSSSFGVKVDYPANTNSSEGTMSISYVRVTVEYKVPSYALTLKKVSGGYNEESYTVEASISNTNLTSYNPSCTLTAPTGFSFTDFSGSGEYTMVSPTTISWNPQFSSKVASSTASFKFDVNVTYPSGQSSYTGTFTLSESLYSSSKSLSATIVDRPSGEGSETDPDAPPFVPEDEEDPIFPLKTLIQDEPIIVETTGTDGYFRVQVFKDDGNWEKAVRRYGTGWATDYRCTTDRADAGDFSVYYNEEWHSDNTGCWPNLMVGDVGQQIQLKFNKIGFYFISVAFVHSYLPTTRYFLKVIVIPSEDNLSTPFFTILEPSEEELNRLGSGYTYIAQSDIKHTTTDTIVRDWYKNNRIGIHNNEVTLFSDTCTDGTSKWSGADSRVTATSDSTGITLTWVSGTYQFWANPSGSEFDYTGDFTVEFDLLSNGNNANIQIYDNSASTYYNKTLNQLNSNNAGHYKIVKDGQVFKTFIDGVEKTSQQVNSNITGACRVGFRWNGASTIKFCNFNIYSTDNPTFQEVFNTAKYWSKATGGLNTYENCEVEFVYDEDYPLYVLMTGDYPEAEDYGYDIGTIKHTEPAIIEKPVYNSREPNGDYPIPITAILDGEDIATLELNKDQTSQAVVLYDFPVDETISTNDKLAIRGLQVRANIEATDNLVVQAKLHSPTGEIGSRSILIDSNDEEIVIGGLGDLWGFTTLQMTHLELWQLELSIANILSQSDSSIRFNNVEIIFYLETVEKQEITIRVEDEDIAYYGAFIETVKIPEGLNTNTSFLSIDGTDTNDAYRQNIREKTITIEFNLSNCELQTSTDMLRQLTKLFVNEKDQYNRPIPKRIQFSHYPNDYFEYIMEEPFDVDTDITDYTIKAQLTVPSGTSYSLYDTVTHTTGNANGLAAVNPIITVRPSDVNIQVSETNTGQVFQIAYTGDWNDHTVEIDCEDRKVYLIKGEDERIDISKYADYNSDWFRLDGEYEFSSVNCTILSVIFNERW